MRPWSRATSLALAAPAAAFAGVVRLRNAWYDRPGASRRASVPVISVGNLAMGGTGKTPLVAWIAARLRADGLVPAVVSRGYGGTAGPGPLLVSNGEGPRVDAGTCGDEPHLLARALNGVIVVVGSNRVDGAACAVSAGAGVVILDDGFQHRRLARDLDIVVLDGRAPFDGGRLLPQGTLREPPSSLARADVALLTRVPEGDGAEPAIQAVRAAGYAGAVVRAGHRSTGVINAAGVPCPPPERALGFCGIGDPQLFREDLLRAGIALAAFQAFRDHQPYSLAAWEELVRAAKSLEVPLITTEKDFSRLQATTGKAMVADLLVLGIETVVWDEPVLLEAVRRAVATGRERRAS